MKSSITLLARPILLRQSSYTFHTRTFPLLSPASRLFALDFSRFTEPLLPLVETVPVREYLGNGACWW